MPSKEEHESTIDPAAMESAKDDMDEATTEKTEPSPLADQAGAGAADLLSGLCEDVLAHILGLAEHAGDAVRTGALSRRWRGLWWLAPALRFASGRWFDHDGSAQGFIASVDDTLALRARSGHGGLGQLEIRFLMRGHASREHKQQLVPSSFGAAARWIRYAMRQGVKSFRFELHLPDESDDDDDSKESPVMALDDLPSSAKLEAMHLDLNDARVRLPATVVFASLTDLTLDCIQVAGDDVHLLSRLVSPACCPILRKLHMFDFTLSEQQNLVLEAGALTELSLEFVQGMRSLDLRAPSLRVLRIEWCRDLESLAAWPPRLEKLTCVSNRSLIIDRGLHSVSRLMLDLHSHWWYAYGEGVNNGSINLMQRCSSVSCLSLRLYFYKGDGDDIDIIKGRIPQLDHVRSLKARVIPSEENLNLHSFGDCVASLLTAFRNLRYLRLDMACFHTKEVQSVPKSNVTCDHWRSNKISFVHLMKADFGGVKGTDCELRFLQYVLSGSTQLQKVLLCFNQEYLQESGRKDFCHMLLSSGTWTTNHHNDDTCHQYEWRTCPSKFRLHLLGQHHYVFFHTFMQLLLQYCS